MNFWFQILFTAAVVLANFVHTIHPHHHLIVNCSDPDFDKARSLNHWPIFVYKGGKKVVLVFVV